MIVRRDCLLKEVKNVTLGLNLFDNRIGGGGFWIHRHCCCSCGNREIPVLSVPGDLFDLFHHRHVGSQKNFVERKLSKF